MPSNGPEHAESASAGSTRRSRWVVTGGIGLAAALGISGFLLLPGAGAAPSDKVTICHRTSSTTNPYTVNSINTSSVDEAGNRYLNGHGDHTGPVYESGMTSGWGDIIPPFTDAGSGSSFPGYNWDGAGQTIWNAGCTPPSPSPTPTETSASPTPTETSASPTPTSVTTSPAPITTSPAPITTSPAPITTSPAPITTSPAPVITANPNHPTGGYPQSVPAGSGPGDLASNPTTRPAWLWFAILALLALSAASFRQAIWGRDGR
jgi:hypothetical protein